MARPTGTHFSRFQGRIHCGSVAPTRELFDGFLWYDVDTNIVNVYYDGGWYGSEILITTTSTSTSTSTT